MMAVLLSSPLDFGEFVGAGIPVAVLVAGAVTLSPGDGCVEMLATGVVTSGKLVEQ